MPFKINPFELKRKHLYVIGGGLMAVGFELWLLSILSFGSKEFIAFGGFILSIGIMVMGRD